MFLYIQNFYSCFKAKPQRRERKTEGGMIRQGYDKINNAKRLADPEKNKEKRITKSDRLNRTVVLVVKDNRSALLQRRAGK